MAGDRIGKEAADALIGIYDLSYAPYALGDVITFQENLRIRAIETGSKRIDLYVLLDPTRPSFPAQSYITRNNHIDYFNSLFPAFLCLSELNSFHLVRDRDSFNARLLRLPLLGQSTWPNIGSYLVGQLDYSSHRTINQFFGENGFIPRLGTPRGYEGTISRLLRERGGEHFAVSVSIRQRALYPDIGFINVDIVSRRDSPVSEWIGFFDEVARCFPDVVFVLLGGFSEWGRELNRFENIVIPKIMGFGLGSQLAVVHSSDLFMGTSSGFAAMATFSETPYIITNFEQSVAGRLGISVGTSRYPFALENQVLSWEKETTGLLLELFEPIYRRLRGQGRRTSGAQQQN